MFEYFPGNYVWNLAVVATLNGGGLIDEVDRACRPIREAADQGSDVGTAELLRAWTDVVDDLESQAEADEKAGHLRTAGQKYRDRRRIRHPGFAHGLGGADDVISMPLQCLTQGTAGATSSTTAWRGTACRRATW